MIILSICQLQRPLQTAVYSQNSPDRGVGLSPSDTWRNWGSVQEQEMSQSGNPPRGQLLNFFLLSSLQKYSLEIVWHCYWHQDHQFNQWHAYAVASFIFHQPEVALRQQMQRWQVTASSTHLYGHLLKIQCLKIYPSDFEPLPSSLFGNLWLVCHASQISCPSPIRLF